MLEKLPDAVGHALRDQRAGLDQILFQRAGLGPGVGAIAVRSLAFADHVPMPVQYTADGDGRSPPLQWTGVPPSATEVVLLVEDADAPTPRPLVHAIVAGLPAGDGALAEGAVGDQQTPEGEVGRNSLLQRGWLPPDPPPGHGTHRYCFQVFALAAGDALADTPGRDDVERAVRERGVASGLLIGTYERPDGSVRVGPPLARASVASDPPLSAILPARPEPAG